MKKARGTFACKSITNHYYGEKSVKLVGVNQYPDHPETNQIKGRVNDITLTIDKEAEANDFFVAGEEYFVDFIKAEEPKGKPTEKTKRRIEIKYDNNQSRNGYAFFDGKKTYFQRLEIVGNILILYMPDNGLTEEGRLGGVFPLDKYEVDFVDRIDEL